MIEKDLPCENMSLRLTRKHSHILIFLTFRILFQPDRVMPQMIAKISAWRNGARLIQVESFIGVTTRIAPTSHHDHSL